MSDKEFKMMKVYIKNSRIFYYIPYEYINSYNNIHKDNINNDLVTINLQQFSKTQIKQNKI